MQKAQNALHTTKADISREWRITAAYYALYFSLYSLFMQLGIKSEIHACTLEIAKLFITKEDAALLKLAFDARIDAQYYVNKNISSEVEEKIMHFLPTFTEKCRTTTFTQKQTTTQLACL